MSEEVCENNFSLPQVGSTPKTSIVTAENKKKMLEELKSSIIWCDVVPVELDYQKLEEEFENKIAEIKLVVSNNQGSKCFSLPLQVPYVIGSIE